MNTEPKKSELIDFIEENELNMFESVNSSGDDIEQTYLDSATFLDDNYDKVVDLFNSKKA